MSRWEDVVHAMSRWQDVVHAMAAASGKLDIVKALTTSENINSYIVQGHTPLCHASGEGQLEVMKFLIAAGADIKECGCFDCTPLHAACYKNKKNAVEFLLANGARECVHVSFYSSNTPLNVAVSSPHVEDGDILKLLLNAGADVNFPDKCGRTPLAEAVRNNGCESLVKVLLEAGADVNASSAYYNMSVLHLAVGCPNIVRLLIEAGADVNRKNDEGEVPLETVLDSDGTTVEVLLDYGAVDFLCERHYSCDSSITMCLYRSFRRYGSAATDCFERYFNKMLAAGLCPGKGNTLVPPMITGVDWTIKKRAAFCEKCKTELANMKEEKVSGTNVTYLDVLYQCPRALMQVESLPFEETLVKFPIYGGLVRGRLLTGRRKLTLLEQSTNFFELPSDPLPILPPECVTEILSYLPVHDLQKVSTICAPHQNPLSTQKSSSLKRSSSLEQVIKHPKLL